MIRVQNSVIFILFYSCMPCLSIFLPTKERGPHTPSIMNGSGWTEIPLHETFTSNGNHSPVCMYNKVRATMLDFGLLWDLFAC